MVFEKDKCLTALCIAILLINSWAPFTSDSPLVPHFLGIAIKGVLIICAGALLFVNGRKKKISSFELIAAIALFTNLLLYFLYKYNDEARFSVIGVVYGIFILLQSDEIRAKTFKIFRKIMVYTTVICIICYISYMFDLGIPYTIVDRTAEAHYINYIICYLSHGIFTRLNGIFNEPGYYGTFAAFFLCADRLNFKKKGNIILLIGGLLSLSLAFVIILIIYYMLEKLNDWKKWIWMAMVAMFVLFALPNLNTGNVYVDNMISRMVISDEGLVGDNRNGALFEAVWEKAFREDMIYTGYGAGYAEYFGTGKGEGLASIKAYIVNFGVIGTLAAFGPIFLSAIWYAWKLRNRDMFLYILITFISLYQRPYLFAPAYFIVFICGMSYILIGEKLTYRLNGKNS